MEVRLIQEWSKVREAEHIRAAYPDRSRDDFVVAYVAKANLAGIHREERYLLRSTKGAFTDVTMTPKPPKVAKSEKKAKPVDGLEMLISTVEGSISFSEDRSIGLTRGTELVRQAIQDIFQRPKLERLSPQTRSLSIVESNLRHILTLSSSLLHMGEERPPPEMDPSTGTWTDSRTMAFS